MANCAHVSCFKGVLVHTHATEALDYHTTSGKIQTWRGVLP